MPSNTLSALLTRRMAICVFTGFSSGLPLYLLFNLLPAWLRSSDVSLKTIGFFALVQIPYTWKFIWAPLLDRFALFPLQKLGRRRSWTFLMQAGLFLVILAFGFLNPKEGIFPVLLLATLLALFSATQDVALDAYRRELLNDDELAAGNGVHVTAYRVAGLVPGSLSLILADHLPWLQVFAITAAFMLPGMLMILAVKEPIAAQQTPKTLRDATILPFQEFVNRAGIRETCLILAFILFYKLGDSLCTALATPFYLDMGFSKTDIGLVAKHAGLWPAVIGGILGSLWMIRLGINRALWVFGVVQLVSIFGFAWLANLGKHSEILAANYWQLGFVIGLEALGVGLGTAAFVAFIARATNPIYTATQFALFTSLAAVPRTFINATAGFLVEKLGWVDFFLLCAVFGIPGMLLLFWVAPWHGKNKTISQ